MSAIPGGAQIPDPSAASHLEIDGLTIRYVTGGAPAGTPLVLLSPWPRASMPTPRCGRTSHHGSR